MDLTIFSLLNLAIIALEVYLATRKSRAAGLVLPALWFGWVLFACVMSAIGYRMHFGGGLTPDAAYLVGALGTLAQANLPTLVLVGIYALCRRQRRRNLNKMRVQDL